jgi:hypothetical protein
VFLKKPGVEINSLKNINEKYREYFIAIDDKEELEKIKTEIIFTYLEGALIIKNEGKKFLDFRHYDFVDQLVAYFVDALDEMEDGHIATVYFPDQPIQINIERKGNELKLKKGKKIINVKFDEFKKLINEQNERLENIETKEEKFDRWIRNYGYMVDNFRTCPDEHIDDFLTREHLYENRELLSEKQKFLLKTHDETLLKNASKMYEYLKDSFDFNSVIPQEEFWWWSLDKIAKGELKIVL